MTTNNSDITFLESLDQPAILWDAELKLSWCSPAAARLLGWATADLVGKPVKELPFIQQQHLPVFSAALALAADGHNPSLQTIDVVKEDAAKVSLEWQHCRRLCSENMK